MKKLIPVLLVFALLFGFSSCVKYHAEAADVAICYRKDHDGNNVLTEDPIVFTESFRIQTMVKGALNGYEAEGLDPETLPETRTVLIDEKDEFDAAFVACPFEVDLEKEMIVVYVISFTNSRPTVIKKVSFTDGVLSIKMENKRAKWGVKDACMPYQRYVVVKLDKLDVDEVKVDYKIR